MVRRYRRNGTNDHDQMMAKRGVSVDHSTIYRWVRKHAPEIEKRLCWHLRRPRSRRNGAFERGIYAGLA